MIIDIEDDLFYKIKDLMKKRSKSIYEQLENITILDTLPTDTLQTARDIKTRRIKESITETIKSLYSKDLTEDEAKQKALDLEVPLSALIGEYKEATKEVLKEFNEMY